MDRNSMTYSLEEAQRGKYLSNYFVMVVDQG